MHSRRIISCILFFLVLNPPCFAYPHNNQKIYPTDSKYYEGVYLLSILAGEHTPSDSGPWSKAELLDMLSHIDRNSLSPAGIDLYDILIEALDNPSAERDSRQLPELSFTPVINAELYTHTNSTPFFDEDEEWAYDYTQRAPLIDLQFEASTPDDLYGYIGFNVQNNRFHIDTGDSTGFFGKPIATNLIIDDSIANLDATSPWRAFISFGGDHWNVQFGRDRIRWGTGLLGNLIVDDHMDYHEFIRFTSFYDTFKFTSMVISFDPPSSYDYEGGTSFDSPISGVELFIAHRLEFRLWDRVNISLSEGMMYQGDTVDLGYLNPLMFYHNLYMSGNSNSIAGIDINAAIARGLHAYGQFVIDEISAPGEKALGANAHPQAFGLLTGLIYARQISEERILSIQLEAVYTDPYMYLRDLDLAEYPIDFIVANRQFVRDNPPIVDKDILGFSLGPDVMAFALEAAVYSLDSWNITTSLSYVLKGCISQDSIWTRGIGDPDDPDYDPSLDPAALISPTSSDPNDSDKDAVEHRLICNLHAELPLARQFILSGNMDWIHRWHAENLSQNGYCSDLQTTLGIKVLL